MRLFVVKPEKFLHLPADVDEDRGLWHEEGGVIDMDDPYVAHAVEGQEYKLAPAPEHITVPSPLPSRRMEIRRNEFMGRAEPEPSEADEARNEGLSRAQAEGVTGGIEKPKVEKPKRAKDKTKEPAASVPSE